MTAQYVYEHGRRWNAKLPRYAICRIVGAKHVSIPFDLIEADIRRRAIANDWPSRLIGHAVKYARCVYDENRALYQRYRF